MKLKLPKLVELVPIFHGMPPTSGSKITKLKKLKREENKGNLRTKEQVGNITRNQTKENKKLEGLRKKVRNQTKIKGILGDLEDKEGWSANLTRISPTNSNTWRGENS